MYINLCICIYMYIYPYLAVALYLSLFSIPFLFTTHTRTEWSANCGIVSVYTCLRASLLFCRHASACIPQCVLPRE